LIPQVDIMILLNIV